jgi:cardiolipin synthase
MFPSDWGLTPEQNVSWTVTAGTLLYLLLLVVFIPWILMSKPETTSAAAWCLLLIFAPYVGAVAFLLFGYQHVNRPLQRKRRHKVTYRSVGGGGPRGDSAKGIMTPLQREEALRRDMFPWNLARLALKFDAFAVTPGNKVDFYHEGQPAFDAMLEAMRSARHHIHVETFIYQPDGAGDAVLQVLTEKARQGVQVRLVYDAMGSLRLASRRLAPLAKAGGKWRKFLPVNPLRRRIQVNLRNHRKIMVVDGRVAFTGGLNIGNEYLCKDPRFGFWRDTHMRLEGPAVSDLQHVFAEDWDFAARERLKDPAHAQMGSSYFKAPENCGDMAVQVIESGPDQHFKSIREIYFAAILAARQRLWIATPYFVPDSGLLDALRLAGYRGVDVRLLTLFHPDKWIPLYAARYYYPSVLAAGIKVYQYTKGMMHSKVVLVDDAWASVGSANFDNRSMYLNFEANCLFYAPAAVAELERAFLHDMTTAIRLDYEVYARRPFTGRFLENACRLMSPVL